LQIALSIATYIISNNMSDFGASVQRINLEIMSLLTKQHPRRDHNLYRTLSNANTKAADADLSSRHVQRGFYVFQHIPCIVSDLPKPDLLHTMQIGMLDHLQKWIFHIMKMHETLDKYNAIWLSMPAFTTSHKKLRHMRKFLNGMGRK
jgi:hypothetical protein